MGFDSAIESLKYYRTWEQRLEFYTDSVERGLPLVPMLRLVKRLMQNEFVRSFPTGTSHHTLLLSALGWGWPLMGIEQINPIQFQVRYHDSTPAGSMFWVCNLSGVEPTIVPLLQEMRARPAIHRDKGNR